MRLLHLRLLQTFLSCPKAEVSGRLFKQQRRQEMVDSCHDFSDGVNV
jgi:hypothetical protein